MTSRVEACGACPVALIPEAARMAATDSVKASRFSMPPVEQLAHPIMRREMGGVNASNSCSGERLSSQRNDVHRPATFANASTHDKSRHGWRLLWVRRRYGFR